jgi:hypothetical protein
LRRQVRHLLQRLAERFQFLGGGVDVRGHPQHRRTQLERRCTSAQVVTIPFGDQPRPHILRIGSVERGQRRDRRRLVDPNAIAAVPASDASTTYLGAIRSASAPPTGA